MVNWKLDLKRNKEGLIIGMLVGLAVTLWLKIQGADLTFAVANPAPLDNVLSAASGVADLATTKVGLAFMAIFGAIGYWIDRMIDPNK